MEMIGEPLNEQQLEQLLVIADLDQDGRINYEGECSCRKRTKDTADAGVRLEGHVCTGRNKQSKWVANWDYTFIYLFSSYSNPFFNPRLLQIGTSPLRI